MYMHNIYTAYTWSTNTFNYPARLQLKIPQTLQDSIGGVMKIPFCNASWHKEYKKPIEILPSIKF